MGKSRNKLLNPSRIGGLILLALLTCVFRMQAQTGLTLLDEQLKPIEGASVAIDNSDDGVVSSAKGEVSLAINANTTVVISHVGFVPQSVNVNPGDWVRVILRRDLTQLNEVKVEGFLSNTRLGEQAGAIARIDPTELKRYGENSLVQAINSVPGIRFEERAGASYRISIRGSSIRSPFGVRNVKVYWNDIPFTEPGGTTFINLLDLTNISDVEIIRGPGASIYGAGNGGVLKLRSTNLADFSNATQFGISGGSFGQLRWNLIHNSLGEKSSITAKFGVQKSNGYREHNEMDRKTAEIDMLFFPDDRRTVSASLLYSDLFYEIPGGLNPDQRAEDPRQSRPRSIERNSSVANELFLLKLGHEYTFSPSFENKTSVSLSANQFENPFILDYKRDNQQVLSGRTEFNHALNGSLKGELAFGAEYQRSFFDGKNFGNVDGQADTIRFADEVNVRQSTLFASGVFPFGDGFSLNTGVSRSTLEYDIDRQIDRINNNPQQFVKEFDDVWSYRISLSKQLKDNLSLHFGIMNGFSPPTTAEVRTNEGSINRILQAERGMNYELNLRGALLGNRLSFDLAAFHFQLDDAITSFTNGDGVVLFRNAGGTEQNGLELQLNGIWIESQENAVRRFTTGLSYTYHDFSFQDYVDSGDDFSGNALPGTSPHVVNIRSDIELRNGFYVNLTYHYSDVIPLNDENTFYSSAYHLVNIRTGFKGKFQDRTNFELFFGVDNLLDESYSLGNDLNAFGRRYFQPAPTANYYLGIKLKFNH